MALLGALSDAGMTQVEIARVAGSSQPSINRLATGKAREPLHCVGAALLDLYASRCRTPLPQLAHHEGEGAHA